MSNHWDTFKDVDYVKTFSQMKTRYDQFEYGKTERSKRESSEEKRPSSPTANPQWKKEREYDNDEIFFNKDDDEEDEVAFFEEIFPSIRLRIGIRRVKRTTKPTLRAVM